MSEQKKSENGLVYWLKLLAAVGIPLALLYLAIAGLFNPQFAEIREALSEIREDVNENREAIAANSNGIERLEAKVDSNIARLEARINLVIEVLILAFTNENVTEAELRSILSAGEE